MSYDFLIYMEKEAKNMTLTIRLTELQKSGIRTLAELMNLSVSQLILRLVGQEYERLGKHKTPNVVNADPDTNKEPNVNNGPDIGNEEPECLSFEEVINGDDTESGYDFEEPDTDNEDPDSLGFLNKTNMGYSDCSFDFD